MFSKRLLLSVCAAPLALASCTTGLTSAPPVVPGQAAPISSAERQQGQQSSAQLIEEFGGAWTGAPSAYVEQVARRVATQSGLSATPQDFTVTVLDSPVANAFATPGGYIYITRGLLALIDNEAELAAVLGHEVGHVAARHSQRRQEAASRNSLLGALGQLLVGAVAGDSGLGQLLGQGIGTGTQLATLGYSRSQEEQADDLGVAYLLDAGYDTEALASMLASLAEQNNLEQQLAGDARILPEWASTHPDPASRVREALAQAQQAGGTELPRNRDAYLSAIDGMLYGDNPRQGIIEGRTFRHPELQIAFTVPQGFSMTNGTRAVTITGPNTQAQFSTASFSGDLQGYVRSVLQSLGGANTNLPAANVQTTRVNGLPAAYAQVRANTGQSQVDVTVFAYSAGNRAYHFTVLTPAGQGLGAASSLVQSFRTLSQSEAAQIRPKYLRVVPVRAGDTIASLAARMDYESNQLERFLVLNSLSRDSTLRAGDRVKIVTY
ncbi:M48 family metalloprotease [Sphingosinithalassobacter sp. LHW66-3]|uniref:M48 family metalloprotease n=1 Tax=Sphingosinithalassobacter sp. LHW66-3 TaxID=3424718 RepID=UPI003D6A58B7